jgi:hypothetical protein
MSKARRDEDKLREFSIRKNLGFSSGHPLREKIKLEFPDTVLSSSSPSSVTG